MNKYKASIGANKYDSNPKDLELTLEELTSLLTTFPDNVLPKGEGRYLVSGHFNGQRRITKHLQQKTLISLDIDFYDKDLASLEVELNEALHPYGYICYSTGSHTPDRPRIRVVLLLSSEVPTKYFKNMSKNFIESLSNFQSFIELECSTMSNNAMYLPTRTSTEYQPWTKVVPGKSIDPEDFKSDQVHSDSNCQLLSKIKKLKITHEEMKSYLNKLDVLDLNYQQWLKVGMAIHHQTSGSDEGLKAFMDWSSMTHQYNTQKAKSELKFKWSTFIESESARNQITFATVIAMVNGSSPSVKVLSVDDKAKHQVSLEGLVPPAEWYQVRGEKLTPVMCIENLEVLLKYYNITVGYNVILKQPSIIFQGKTAVNLNSATTEIKSLCVRNNLSHILVGEYLAALSHKNKINPWKDWITSKPWDGVDRIGDFCNTVVVKEGFEDSRDIYIKRWLQQMIHITCLNDGEKSKMGRSVLVFQGNQRIGKTTWFNHLVPESKSNFIQSGVTLGVSSDMSVLACVRHAIVELGELDATFRKSDMEHLKNFISSTRDIINIKYQAHHMEARRRTVFFASVNDSQFLQDQTGNSRFLVLPVKKCNAYHNIDQQQLYAQLLESCKNNPNYELTEEECAIRDNNNKEFESVSFLEEKFRDVYDVDQVNEETYQVHTATQVLENLGMFLHSMKVHRNSMAKILDNMGYKRSKNNTKRGWFLPPLLNKKDVFF